jgi:hypothetical protein
VIEATANGCRNHIRRDDSHLVISTIRSMYNISIRMCCGLIDAAFVNGIIYRERNGVKGLDQGASNLSYREASIFRACPDCHVNSLNTKYHCLNHDHRLYHRILQTNLSLPPQLRSPVPFSSSTDSTNSANTNWQTSQDTYNTTVQYLRGS